MLVGSVEVFMVADIGFFHPDADKVPLDSDVAHARTEVVSQRNWLSVFPGFDGLELPGTVTRQTALRVLVVPAPGDVGCVWTVNEEQTGVGLQERGADGFSLGVCLEMHGAQINGMEGRCVIYGLDGPQSPLPIFVQGKQNPVLGSVPVDGGATVFNSRDVFASQRRRIE